MKKLIDVEKEILGSSTNKTRDDLVKLLDTKLAALSESQRSSATFTIKRYYEKYDPYEYVGLFINYKCLETDEEEIKREALALEAVKKATANEYTEYARLKDKFKVE